MQKKNWIEVTTQKTTKSEEKNLYNELIQKDTDTLEREKTSDIRKHNILDIFNNVGSIFTGAYLHYKDGSKETMFERSIEERIKLRRGRTERKHKLFKTYFTNSQSPSNMYNT